MIKIMHTFEKVMALALIVILAVVIVLTTIHLGITTVRDFIEPPYYLFDIHKLLEFLGILLPVVIAVELLGTLMAFFDKSVVRIELIFLIAMMALAREVIILDLHKIEGGILMGVAAIIGALSVGYFLIKRSLNAEGEITKVKKEEAEKGS